MSDIRTVTHADLPAFQQCLRALSQFLGDDHTVDAATLEAAILGPDAYAIGFIAGQGDGALLASPMLSTVSGGLGIYVSDLWVAEAARGTGLGRRLLAAALGDGRWGRPRFIKLTVYAGNAPARAVYDRLGFAVPEGEAVMMLDGSALERLRGD